MEDKRLGENLMTATAAEANPSHHFDRRLKIKGGVEYSISSLPDEILHQILSLIPTKLAITTSVLSKRWKHVWCETPCLYFPGLKSSSGSISKTLASYSAAKITSFRLRTRVSNTKRAQLVNSLIEFAMSHNVETLSLKFRYSNSMSYSLPDFLFSNSSLKQLTVDAGFCLISLRCTVSWTSLRSLSLISVQISAESLSRMLSGCPMLEILTLVYWGSVEYLDLSKTLCLKKLDIVLTSWVQGTMQIVAPHIYSLRLRTLRFLNDKAQSNCTLVDVSSLTEANIDFGKFLPRIWLATHTSKAASIHTMVQTILEKLQNVENLTLGVSFLQMLSIAEFRGVPFATFKVKTLTLETMILRSVVPGLARLLQNSPGLKKIILYSIDCFTEVDICVNHYLDKQNLNSGRCWRLKDEVCPDSWECGFAEPKLVGSFVELLLANTRTLETLVLRLGRYFDRSRLRELSEITRTLSDDNNVSIVIK